MLRVVVDEREKPSGVPDELSALGALVDYRVLEVGDYVVRDYAIERKSVRDFIRSLWSGRVRRELAPPARPRQPAAGIGQRALARSFAPSNRMLTAGIAWRIGSDSRAMRSLLGHPS